MCCCVSTVCVCVHVCSCTCYKLSPKVLILLAKRGHFWDVVMVVTTLKDSLRVTTLIVVCIRSMKVPRKIEEQGHVCVLHDFSGEL